MLFLTESHFWSLSFRYCCTKFFCFLFTSRISPDSQPIHTITFAWAHSWIAEVIECNRWHASELFATDAIISVRFSFIDCCQNATNAHK